MTKNNDFHYNNAAKFWNILFLVTLLKQHKPQTGKMLERMKAVAKFSIMGFFEGKNKLLVDKGKQKLIDRLKRF